MIYYLFGLLSVGYFLTVARPYLNIVRAGNAKMLLKEGRVALALDALILACALANIVMGVREHLGLVQSHLPSLAVWAIFSAVAVHRITEEVQSIEARMAEQGEQA